MSKNKQTVSATPQGLERAQRALKRLFEKQSNLAENLEGSVGRSTIQKFFQGKDIQVDKFKEICKALTLESNWEAIAGLIDIPDSVDVSSNSLPEQVLEGQDSSINIDTLVQDVREKVRPYIEEHCGTMRVLDMTQPIGLGDIYTSINTLEDITGCRGLNISKLRQNYNLEEIDRFSSGRIIENRIPGLKAAERYPKLMILGKPGAGKTTFLKHLALQCLNREFEENLIPFFITLKEFAEFHNQLELPEFIVQELDNDTIAIAQVIQLLKSGKFLLLLDGLGAVKEKDSSNVISRIKKFSEQYRENRFIITCRIAAQEYLFEKFTVVEIADFDEPQIELFVSKWFQNKTPDMSSIFIQQLQSNSRIKELAIHPLLLTLLCLEFEYSKNFPSDRAELYNRAINTLLEKWDSMRGIVRDVRDEISLTHLEDLLSEVAWTTFERSDYFFKQRDIEEYIQDYIRNLPETRTDLNALRVDSKAVLKRIKAHHGLLVERARGIYSFSHLTFHEYFTAREIVYSSKQENYLKSLSSKISEKRWQEVFLLTVGLLNRADTLLKLIKQQIDTLLAGDIQLQHFLTWVKRKSESVETAYKAAAIRAFYFYLYLSQIQAFDFSETLDLNLSFSLDRTFSVSLNLKLDYDFFRTLDLSLSIDRTLSQTRTLSRSDYLDLFLSLDSKLDHELSQILTPDQNNELQRCPWQPSLMVSLQELRSQLSHNEVNTQRDMVGWQKNRQVWAEGLRKVMIKHRDIGHDWQFNEPQKKFLRQYYDANKLLVDCLDSSRYVSPEVRQQIEDTLLLPEMREI